MRQLDNKYSFDADATNWIVSIARGHPFYVHLVGKQALLRAISLGTNTVTQVIAEEALADIALKGSAPIQETTYQKAIGNSYVRETILKQFAKQANDEIYTTDIYATLARELQIDGSSVSVYVGQLASEKYGSVLNKTRERHYQFADSLFKAYAAARPYVRSKGDLEED